MNRLLQLISLLVLSSTLFSVPQISQADESPKYVLVTGTSTGIGRNLAETLARNGYHVYAGVRKDQDYTALNAIKNVTAVRLDVTRQNEIDAVLELIRASGTGLYGLVNNAGVGGGGTVADTPVEQQTFVYDVNVEGVYRVTSAFAPLIIESQGRIVTTGSIAGTLSWAGGSAYAGSKHWIEAFTDALAAEMEPQGVSVSVVEPGNYQTHIRRNSVLREFERMTAAGGEISDDMHRLYEDTEQRELSYELPDAVSAAFMHALFDGNPLRRYMVVPSAEEQGLTIATKIEQLLQLNTWGPYSYDRDELVAMLDQALAARQPAADDADITEAELSALIQVLASDEFEGRAPNTPGEDKTIAWLTERFREVGLKPGNAGSFTQAVPLAKSTVKPESAQLSLKAADGTTQAYRYRDDMVIWPKAGGQRHSISDSELVFVGYGIVAPEYDWDDYGNIDMSGKTAVILINDPGFATEDAGLFNGRSMTYYGRYTYKFEEARRQGAAAALIIHETAPAAYPWDVVRSSWTGPQFDLVRESGTGERLPMEGWVQNYVAEELLANAGLTLEAAHSSALSGDFAAIPLGASVNISLEAETADIESNNVIGRIEGAVHPEETIIYMAHWDHFGVGEAVDGDAIYNGARDNASSTAALIELAEKFLSQDAPPERSILFLAVTAEEFGLLGSAFYAENPLVPTAQTVAAINMDGANIWGPVRDITVVGYGQNDMQDYLVDAATAQGRRVDPEPLPEKGYFYRSDHFMLAKKGIPVLYTNNGIETIDG
ncbi:MAG: Zn-dependent M28 family amino/carboxypeptidase/short-subunit dehydrogenase, partial [Halieaceae bacterium]